MRIKKLDWDSDFFGFGIARLFPGKIKNINQFAKKNKISLIWTLAKTNNSQYINRLAQNGFDFVDLRLTFVMGSHAGNATGVRLAKKGDLPDLKKIAGRAFMRNSRFNHKRFGRKKSRALYRLWVEKSVEGKFDSCCLVIERKGGVAGFATYKRIGKKSSAIGLIAVSNSFRGLGIGSKLIAGCLDLAYKEGRKALLVGTEGKNIAAQNFYLKSGFRVAKIESWYYKWVN